MARSGAQQVRPLGPAAGDTQPAQRPHPPRLLAGGAREGQDYCLPRPLSLGRLSPPGVHDARRRRGRRQPLERLSRAQGGRQAGASNRDTLPQGEGIRAAPAAPRALARRCLLPQICGTFFFLCSILDGYSRFVVHWEIRETMKEAEVETILQRARERYPDEHPRIITDNGPQFVARDFKDFIRICGMTHVKTSPYYPQSNGKIERWFKTLKGECIRVATPLTLEDARRLVAEFVTYYNTVRLHSAIAYITPADKLAGRAEAIWAARREKLAQADARRRAKSGEKAFAPSPSPELH